MFTSISREKNMGEKYKKKVKIIMSFRYFVPVWNKKTIWWFLSKKMKILSYSYLLSLCCSIIFFSNQRWNKILYLLLS